MIGIKDLLNNICSFRTLSTKGVDSILLLASMTKKGGNRCPI